MKLLNEPFPDMGMFTKAIESFIIEGVLDELGSSECQNDNSESYSESTTEVFTTFNPEEVSSTLGFDPAIAAIEEFISKAERKIAAATSTVAV
jgi:hypothetical protein